MLRAIKTALIRRDSKHVRHSRHGIIGSRAWPTDDTVVVFCRCGEVIRVTALEIEAARPRDRIGEEKRRRRLKAQAREAVLAEAQRRDYEMRYLWYMATGEMRRKRDAV